MASAGSGRPVSLEQLIALNDEIANLVRAGVPLGSGLMQAGRGLPGRLGAITRSLAARLERGEGLAEAVEAEGGRLPPIYRGVVEAGVRSGRLTAALEGLAGFARTYAEVRRAVGLALLYPLIVASLAYALFLGMIAEFIPRLLGAFEALQVEPGPPLSWAPELARSIWWWGPVLPALLLLFAAAWVSSRRSASLQPGWMGGAAAWIPWMGAMLGSARAASFADLLALLIEHGTPLGQALRIAAQATGDARMGRAAGVLAGADERGETIRPEMLTGLPPMTAWLVATRPEQPLLAAALKNAADAYRRRALDRSARIRILMPTILLVGVGGLGVLAYGLTFFAPISRFMATLTMP